MTHCLRRTTSLVSTVLGEYADEQKIYEDEECDAPQLGDAVLALALTAAEVVRRDDGCAVVGVAVQTREVLRAGESGRKTRKEGEGGGDEAGERQRASFEQQEERRDAPGGWH